MEGNSEWLAEQFETHRTHLRAGRAGCSARPATTARAVWLTTMLSRVCLDMLRSQKSRREKPLDAGERGPAMRAR